MAVYQSATEPLIRYLSYKELVSGTILDSVGKRRIIHHMRRSNNIPAKVVPEESFYDGHWQFTFRWFEVETNA